MTVAKAAVLRSSDAPFAIETITLDDPRSDEVLVQIVATGVCHTDMVMRDQGLPTPQPVVLGHEGAGIVVAVGTAVTHLVAGDHVVLSFNSCGHCPSCAESAPAYCHEFFPRNFMGLREDGTSPLNGDGGAIYGNIFGQSSFATYAIAHARNAVKVDADVPLHMMGPLGCGIMTGAGAVLNALRVAPEKSVAVFGAGAVGLSAVMAAKVAGAATIIAIDRNVERLTLALELGATHTIPVTADVATVLKEVVPGGVDYALDTTANTHVIRTAADLLAPRGTLGLVGASAVGDEICLDAVGIMSAGRTVRGIVEGDADPHKFIPRLIELYKLGQFPFDRLIRFYPFADINLAFADGESGRVVKPVVQIG